MDVHSKWMYIQNGSAKFAFLRICFYICNRFNNERKKHMKTARVISKESVRRGNAATMSGQSRCVSMDGRNVSIRRHTVSGVCMMTFSRKDIATEASKAYGKVVR